MQRQRVTKTSVLSSLRRGSGIAAFALAAQCVAPSTAHAAPVCTEPLDTYFTIQVPRDGSNFYSVDADDWMGGFNDWYLIETDPVPTIDVVFEFYGAGTLTVDQDDYEFDAGDTLALTFAVNSSYQLSVVVDPTGGFIPEPSWGKPQPPPQSPEGPLPNNEVIIHPKPTCPPPPQ